MREPLRLRNPDVDAVLREMNGADPYRMLDDGSLDLFWTGAARPRCNRNKHCPLRPAWADDEA